MIHCRRHGPYPYDGELDGGQRHVGKINHGERGTEAASGRQLFRHVQLVDQIFWSTNYGQPLVLTHFHVQFRQIKISVMESTATVALPRVPAMR